MTGLIEIVSDAVINSQTQESDVLVNSLKAVVYVLGVATVGVSLGIVKTGREVYKILNRPAEQLDLFYDNKR